MKEKLILHVAKLAQEQKRWKRWHKTVTVMAAVVVFCTVYALILPAVTMGAKTFCGMEEHIHTEECYLLRRIGAATPSDAERWDIDEELGTPSNAELEERLEEMREFYLTEGGKGTASNGNRATASNAMEYEWDENDKYKYDMNLIGDDSFLLDDYLEYTEGMEYDEDNYELIRICEMEEHTHSLICYSDPEADLEDEAVWTQTIPELSGNIPEDLIRVAESQMNYRESEKNYQVEGVDEKKGYSRYGQWYGEPYGDWGTMFVSFCMNYAGVENAPVTADFDSLMQSMKGGVPELYREKDYIPKPGDLVFAAGAAGEPGRVGIITEVTLDGEGNVSRFTAVEGDYENRVTTRTHRGGEEDIRGFAALSKFGPDEEIVIITLKAETENAVVTATFEKDTLPEKVKMEAEEISREDPKAVEMRERLAEQGKSEGKVLTAMIPLNIAFLDEEGNTAEPAGPVQYSVEFKTPVKSVDGENEESGEGHSETSSAFGEETPEETAASGEDQENARIEEETPAWKETEGEISGTAAYDYGSDGWQSSVSEISGADRVQISAREVVRVGAALNETEEDQEKTSWELYHQSPDGALENYSGDNKTEINKTENGALLGASFEIGEESGQEVFWLSQEGISDQVQTSQTGNLNMYLAAYRMQRDAVQQVGDFAALKSALQSSEVTTIQLTQDFERPATEGVIVISGENNYKTLDLNGHVISLNGADSLINVVGKAHLTIQDSAVNENKITKENQGELESLWYDDDSYEDTIVTEGKKSTVGKNSRYDSDRKTLEFYVTTVKVDAGGNDGATKEELVKYTISDSGVIKGSGAEEKSVIYLSGGTLTLESGAIVGAGNRAILSEGEGDVLNLNGGYLCGNASSGGGWGGAVEVRGGNENRDQSSVINLTGTILSGNTSGTGNGGAISVTHGNQLLMSGGYVTNNRGSNGGGIAATDTDGPGGPTLQLLGGYITNNLAETGGGGVFKSGECTVRVGSEDNEGTVCFISRNLAVSGEGGGMTISDGKGEIFKGYFTNNRTDTHHHWGGGGLFVADGAEAYMENALVVDNTAGGFGGGVTGCPTSRIYMSFGDGMAIYGNHAGVPGDPDSGERAKLTWHLSGKESGKRQDHDFMLKYEKFLQNGYSDFFCALQCEVDTNMLGGASAHWYGTADEKTVDNPGGRTLACAGVMGLNARPDDTGKAAAREKAKVYFNGNSSWTHAGGILCDGYLIVGNVEEISVVDRMILKGTKSLVNENGQELHKEKDQFKFTLYNSQFVPMVEFDNLESQKGQGSEEEGLSTINFNVRLPGTQEGTFTYYLEEDGPGNGEVGEILFDSTIYKIEMYVKKETSEQELEFVVEGQPRKIRKYLYTITDAKVWERTDGKMKEVEGWRPVSDARFEQNQQEQESDTLYLTEHQPTFTNVKKAYTQVTVHKRWGGDGNYTGDDRRPVTVALMRDGTEEQRIELNNSNNWSHTWTELPTVINEKPVTYSVKEIDVPPGFQSITGTVLKKGYWIPATKLEKGHQYVIVNRAGDQVLAISDEHSNAMFTSQDKKAVQKRTDSITVNGQQYEDWYPAETFEPRSIFTPQQPTLPADKDGTGKWVLVTQGLTGNVKNAWLLLENGLITGADFNLNFKSTDGCNFASSFEIDSDSSLKGTYRFWYDSTETYYVTYDGTQFNSSTNNDHTARIYTLAGGDDPEITITNIPDEHAKFWLTILKVSKANKEIVVPLAEFKLTQLKDGIHQELKFKKENGIYTYYSGEGTEGVDTKLVTDSDGALVLQDIPKGTYVLVETKAPDGFSKIEDQTIVVDSSNPNASGTHITLTIEEPSYILPETGGGGRKWYALGGMLFMMAGGLVYGYSSRRRRERRYES